MNKNKLINPYWLQWFIGFMDAEGNFQVFLKKRTNSSGAFTFYNIGYGIHLSLSLRDKELIYEIFNVLKLGKIYEYPDRDEIHYAITKLMELKELIIILDQYPLLTRHQRDRYLKLRWGVLNQINRAKDLEEYNYLFQNPINGLDYNVDYSQDGATAADIMILRNWISGFLNGEGTFYVSKKENRKPLLIFSIEQTEREVLDLIRQYFEFGPQVLTTKLRESRKQTYSLSISSKRDINKLIKFFTNGNPNLVSLQGYKKVQFYYWKGFFSDQLTSLPPRI